MFGEQLEVFRFYPDGGASGLREFRLTSGKLTKILKISALTGKLETVNGGGAVIRRKNSFTLVEVVTALAILSLGVVSYLTLANMAQRRLIKARERWTNFHMLSQGVEYFMLQNSEDPDPPDLEFSTIRATWCSAATRSWERSCRRN